MTAYASTSSGSVGNGAARSAGFQPLGPPNVAPAERIASGIAGAALAGYAITKKRDAGGAALAIAGGLLLFRGISGQCMGYKVLRTGTVDEASDAVIPHGQGIRVEKAFTIDKPADELFAFWRNFENLPRFMAHLERVRVIDDTHSHWVAKAPFGKTVEWDAEIVNEEPGRMIAWKSVGDPDVPNAGSVWFKPVPGDRGTEVRINLEYNPPAGVIGATVAKLFGEEPGQQINDDLRHFKNLMESGEVPTVIGQPQANKLGYTTA